MTLPQRRGYRGKLQAVVLDWAGTTVDYGCLAPVVVFVEGFRARGIEITMEEARLPMGKFKRDHIAAILAMPRVADLWQAEYGRLPTDDDVQSLYEDFIPRQIACITQYADPIPGVVEMVAALRERGLKIGSCTGYTRAMMQPLLAAAAERGYSPDALVCPDDVQAGRPVPWMCFANAVQLNVYPMSALVKIGDTIMDIEEGLNAGMWTIGLAKTGNEIGLTEAEVNALDPDELQAKLATAYTHLLNAGAHYVVDSLSDILPVLAEIENHLVSGEKP